MRYGFPRITQCYFITIPEQFFRYKLISLLVFWVEIPSHFYAAEDFAHIRGFIIGEVRDEMELRRELHLDLAAKAAA